MIIKNYEINKINLNQSNFLLLYGENEGAKKDFIKSLLKEKIVITENYHENEILNNLDNFFNTILTRSFFNKEKIIIVKKVTNKILEIITKIIEQKLDDVKIFLDADILDKKSKLRNYFEKQKELICVPFYSDNFQSLNIIVKDYFKNHKINLSQQSINIIIDRCNGSRQHLYNELDKINNLSLSKKKIDLNDILKLTNLGNQNEISEIIDLCLSKNKSKIIKILNENNFSGDESVFIVRILIVKIKRLLKLIKNFSINKNMEEVIASHKPPIFWKDKELIKQQIKNWKLNNINNLLTQTSKVELLIKKTPQQSKNILTDFLLEIST